MAVEEVKRGEIYMATFDINDTVGSEQSGNRPVIILQNDTGNKHSPTTIVAFLTSSPNKRINHLHVRVENIDSTILLEQIRTISKFRLGRKIGELSESDMIQVNIKLAYSLGLIDLD